MSDFRIDVYSSADVKLSDHTTEVSNVSLTERVNQIGELSFTISAVVAAQLSLDTGLRYRLYHSALGYLGVYTHVDMSVDANQKLTTIKCFDSLYAASNKLVGFGRSYTNATLENVLNQTSSVGHAKGLLSDPDILGWTAIFDFDATSVNVSLDFQGESVLKALDILRQYFRGFFRRETDTSILFGRFASTTVRARLASPILASAPPGNDFGVITSLKRERHGTSIVNRVFPSGAGIGTTQLDLRYSDRTTPYSILNKTFIYDSTTAADDVTSYYIENAVSITAHGLIERVLPVTEIRPITNSAADLKNAGNALYDLSVAFLDKYKDEQDAYSIECVNLPATTDDSGNQRLVKVGDLIRIDFHGSVELETGTVSYLTLDNQLFFITELTRQFGDSGNPVVRLTVSKNGEEIVGSTEVFSSILEDVSKLKLRVQPSQTYYTKASGLQLISPTYPVSFVFYIGAEVLALNEMNLEFTLGSIRGSISPTTTTDGDSVSVAADVATALATHHHFVNVYPGPTLGFPNYQLWEDAALKVNSNNAGFTDIFFTSDEGASHDHGITFNGHAHNLLFGAVSQDDIAPHQVYITVDGEAVNEIFRVDHPLNPPTSYAGGTGFFTANILPQLLQTDFRKKTHIIYFTALVDRGFVYAAVSGRVTIQPIAVV